MGNSCPSGFQLNPVVPGTCVPQCPTEKGFSFRIANGVPQCVHSSDQTLSVQLNPLPALDVKPNEPVPTIEQLATSPNTNMRRYKEEWQRFNQAIPVIEAKVNKVKEVQDAFKALQDAENVRDKSPDAYQTARIRYYTLVKGEGWAKEEAERVGKAEADPLLNQYRAAYQQTLGQIDKQQKTLDVVQGVKDKVLSLRDDLDYSVSTFGKQIKEIKNQINMNRSETKEDENFWVNFLLNAMIVLISLGVAFMLFTKIRSRMAMTTTTTYTGGAVGKGNAVSNLSRHR
jgi:soluble cytochrome b562